MQKELNGHTELENATTEIKNVVNGFKRKLNTTEERISELKQSSRYYQEQLMKRKKELFIMRHHVEIKKASHRLGEYICCSSNR